MSRYSRSAGKDSPNISPIAPVQDYVPVTTTTQFMQTSGKKSPYKYQLTHVSEVESRLQDSKSGSEIIALKEKMYNYEIDLRQANQKLYDQQQLIDMQQQKINSLERTIEQGKSSSEKNSTVFSDLKKKITTLTDTNYALENQLEEATRQVEKLNAKLSTDHQKYKETLENLKSKSNTKINELKQNLKQAQQSQLKQQEEFDDFKELVKEQEEAFNQLSDTHKSVLKQLETQYKQKYMNLETDLLAEHRQAEEALLKNHENQLNDKENLILEQQKELRTLKDEVIHQSLEIDKLTRINQLIDQQSKKSNQEIVKQISELQTQNQIQEEEIMKRDKQIEQLLEDLDEIKLFSEQTLDTLRQNGDYVAQLEQEKNQQMDIIQDVQRQLEIEYEGSFSYRKLGQELENKCKQLIEAAGLKEQRHQQEQDYQQREIVSLQKQIQEKQIQYEDELKTIDLEVQKTNFIQQDKIQEIQKQLSFHQQQSQEIKVAYEALVKELQQTLQELQQAKLYIESLVQKDKNSQQDYLKKLNIINSQTQSLSNKLEKQRNKNKLLQQKLQRNTQRQKEISNQLLANIKKNLLNQLGQLWQDCLSIIYTIQKKFDNIHKLAIQELEQDKADTVDQMANEMDRRLDVLRKQFKQSENLIQEEALFKLKMKQSQVEQIQRESHLPIDELRNQLIQKSKEVENLRSQVKLLNECQLAQTSEILTLSKLVKDYQEQLMSQSQFAEYSEKKEKEFYESKMQELDNQSQRNLDSVRKRNFQSSQQQASSLKKDIPRVQSSQEKLSNQIFQIDKYASPEQIQPVRRQNLSSDKKMDELKRDLDEQKRRMVRMKLNYKE